MSLWRSIPEDEHKLVVFKMTAILSRCQCFQIGIQLRHNKFVATKPSASSYFTPYSWWRHQMETFSALLALCAGNSPATCEFPSQRPVTRSFDVFFDLRLNKRLSKQSRGWWFETPSHPLWRHCNVSPGHRWLAYSNYRLYISRFCGLLV